MRSGALEQLATPEQVFEEPATDYVAGFIGMGNRLELERRDGRWTHDGVPVEALSIDTAEQTIVIRTRSEDVDLVPSSEPSPHDSLIFNGKIVDSEFGGRHMDVVLMIGETRVQSRIPAGERESWARTLESWPAGPRVDQADARSRYSTAPGNFCRRALARLRSEAEFVDQGRWTHPCRWREHQTARPPSWGFSHSSLPSPISRCCRSSGYRSKRLATTASRTATLSPETGCGRPSVTRSSSASDRWSSRLVLGTYLAWAASVLPPRLRFLKILPIFPIILPAVSAIVGWVFLLSPVPGYLNAALRHLPWWSDRLEGPFDIYTLPFIMIITGLSLASFVYLFVSSGFENINGELIEAAQVAGSSRAGVFFKVVLPLLRPSLVYGGGVALLLGLGQFTAPLLLGRTQGVSVLTTDMFFATHQHPAGLRGRGSDRVAPADIRHRRALGQPRLARRLVAIRDAWREGRVPSGHPRIEACSRIDRDLHAAVVDPAVARADRGLPDAILDGHDRSSAPGPSMRTGSYWMSRR